MVWFHHKLVVLERTVRCSRTVRFLVKFGRFEVRFWAKMICSKVFEVRYWSSANFSEHWALFWCIKKGRKEGNNFWFEAHFYNQNLNFFGQYFFQDMYGQLEIFFQKIFHKKNFLALKCRKFWLLQKFEVRSQMFEFGFISRAKCSKFDLPKFGEFEVRSFDVRSKTNLC